MDEKTTPDVKEKQHGWFMCRLYIFTSAICSFGLIFVLALSAVMHAIVKGFQGDKQVGLPDVEEQYDETTDCFPDMENLKMTNDLRYYALQLGLELKEYRVKTKDGFILILQRLIDPKNTDEQRKLMKPMLFQHGLLSSSGCFLTPGSRSLPVYFLRQGYDVWLGNNRGGFEAIHEYYEGNLMHNELFWDWDIRDLAKYDITCLIENVLTLTSHKKLTLVGHLQGCTQSFLMLKTPELQETHRQIECFIALAPAIYPGVLFHQAEFLKFMCNRSKLGYKIFFGICCFLNFMTQTRNRFHSWPIYGNLSVKMFNFLFSWNGSLWNKNHKIWRLHFIFNVSFVSSKLMTWWLSYWREESFRNELVPKEAFNDKMHFAVTDDKRYIVDDSKTFFPFKQPWFGESNVPVVIFNGDIDNLVDGKRLATHMKTYEPCYKLGENLHIFNLQRHSHLDVIWSNNVIRDIGIETVNIIGRGNL